ncbi:MAG: class I SAM-dependent methyltransferase [Micromonosporaceae bacterium]|nr:class I SAM-dependent methyltransferase [Micromonosporaceae bacterium]
MQYILFPGRHHLLTRFQAEYLNKLASEGTSVVWAVTSANHENTRRNPVPYHRREAAIERFSLAERQRCLVVPVFDTAHTDRFAEVTLKNVEATLGLRLTPETTLVACSTPEVAQLYRRLGFTVAGVEAEFDPVPPRPWDVLLMLAAGDPQWRELAHPASVDVLERYRLDAHVRTVVNDPVVGDEGGLTTTRDYHTYAESFEGSAARKWALARDHIRPGRIVDIGCGNGAVLALADREPALRESDLIGVEVARHLYEECVHRKAQGEFTNPNTYFYCRNVLGGAVLAARSVDTTLSFALTHEIWSYGDRLESVRRFAEAIYTQTVPGGVWINSDVCGPAGRDRTVLMRLSTTDGASPDSARRDLGELALGEVAAYVAGLSTRARLDQFATDYRFPMDYTARPDGAVEIRLADAMDFLTHKDYVDNWLSEAHEQFCGMEYADWVALLREVGFEVDPVSRAWRNDWIVQHRLARPDAGSTHPAGKPIASLSTLDGEPLDWPETHVLLVARRPRGT